MAEGGTGQKSEFSESRLVFKPTFFYPSLLRHLVSLWMFDPAFPIYDYPPACLQHTVKRSVQCQNVLNGGSHPHQKPCRHKHSTVAGLFIDGFQTHQLMHSIWLTSFQNPYFAMAYLADTPLCTSNVQCSKVMTPTLAYVIPSSRTSSWDDGSHLRDRGPNTSLRLQCPTKSLAAEGCGLGE